MRRLLWLALAAGAACSEVSKVESGPTDRFYRPGGIGVYAGNLVVASTNSDLLYDAATGGSVITVNPADVPAGGDPHSARWIGGINIASFASQLAIVDATVRPGRDQACPVTAPRALVPVRGADVLYDVALGGDAAPSCAGCALPLGRNGHFADAFAVTVGCAAATASSPAMAKAYVGYLRGEASDAWVTEVDLLNGNTLRSNSYGPGRFTDFAFDAGLRRLYAAQAGLGVRWIDVDGCALDVDAVDGGCRAGIATLPVGVDAQAIALSRPDAPGANRRLYVLSRVVDARAGSSWGVALNDVDAVLLVTEIVDDLYGGVTLRIVKPPIPVGYGPVALALLPGRAGKRDVVAALTSDDGALLIYDDDDDSRALFGRSPVTGHPWMGSQPFGLAVDPTPTATNTAILYVGSWAESFVTRLVVPLSDVSTTPAPSDATLLRLYGGK